MKECKGFVAMWVVFFIIIENFMHKGVQGPYFMAFEYAM